MPVCVCICKDRKPMWCTVDLHIIIFVSLWTFKDGRKKEESLQWLKNAATQGSSHAAFELWKLRFCQGPLEPYSRLERLRELRDCTKDSHPDAQLTLALEYAQGNFGGITKSQVVEFISQVCFKLIIVKSFPTSPPLSFAVQMWQQQCTLISMISQKATKTKYKHDGTQQKGNDNKVRKTFHSSCTIMQVSRDKREPAFWGKITALNDWLHVGFV